MFLKAELHKESKNGFKTINSSPPPSNDFFKNCFFGAKKFIKKIERFVDFEFLWPIYMNNLDQFLKNLIPGLSESAEI